MDDTTFQNKKKMMVENQIIARGIKSKSVINAFMTIDRHLFVGNEQIKFAYEDYPLDIGCNQTISQPYIVALMIDSLEINKNDSVLEIGTGSGYQTALLACLAKQIYTIDINEKLIDIAEKRLSKLNIDNVVFVLGNGYFGLKDYAPFNKIIVSCAADSIPIALISQLCDPGRMVIPVDRFLWQDLVIIKKSNNQIIKESLGNVRFVPMIK